MSTPGAISRGRRLVLAAVALVAVGSIGPWVDLSGSSQGGLDSDGRVTIVMAAIAGAYVVFVSRPHWSPVAMAGFLSAFVAIFDIFDIEDTSGFVGALASPGWGIILAAIGSVALLLSALLVLRGEDPDAEMGIIGKVLVGLGALLIALFLVFLISGGEEVADVTVPAPAPQEIQPSRSP